MPGKKPRRQRATVIYPRHAFKPEDLLRFVELKPFADAWKWLRLDDEDLMALQIMIMLNPTGHPVIKGTGGLRKMRFSSPRWHVGKSGAVRVCYLYLQEYGTILLVLAYGKEEKDDLTPNEKKTIRSLIERVEREFSSGIIR
jgi:hypothetical protein